MRKLIILNIFLSVSAIVVWFKKIDDKWTICLSPSFYAFSDDPFLDGKPERAKEIIERVGKWESHKW